MAAKWFRIKNGSHSYRKADGSPGLVRTAGALGYQAGDEFFQSEENLAAEPLRWEAVRTGPAEGDKHPASLKERAKAPKKL